MKILFLVRDMGKVKQPNMVAHNSFCQEIARQNEVVRWWGNLQRGFDKNFSMVDLVEQHKPDIIFKYGFRTPFEKSLDLVNVPKIIYLVDYFPAKDLYNGRGLPYREFMRKAKWDLSLVPVTEMVDYVRNDAQVPDVCTTPFSVDTNIFKDSGLIRDIDVTAMFTIRDDVYPNRRKVVRAIRDIKGIKISLGKGPTNKYINALNRTKIFVTSNNIFGSMSMKYTECMASATFLLADEPADWQLFGYKRNQHFVIYNGMRDLKDKIKYFLKHNKEREEIAQNGMRFVRTNHNHVIRAKQFTEIIRKRFNIQ